MKNQKPKKKKTFILNFLFIMICGSLFIFLLRAPEETTAHLPKDDDHKRFFSIKSKKEAEKFCSECHSPDADSPLPEKHPPKYRCLFCHKRTD